MVTAARLIRSNRAQRRDDGLFDLKTPSISEPAGCMVSVEGRENYQTLQAKLDSMFETA